MFFEDNFRDDAKTYCPKCGKENSGPARNTARSATLTQCFLTAPAGIRERDCE